MIDCSKGTQLGDGEFYDGFGVEQVRTEQVVALAD